MARPEKFSLRALRSVRYMPLPELPWAQNYGAEHVGEGHDVLLFPAVLRTGGSSQVESVVEAGQSSCFFHPNLAASQICDLSGRLICELCQTEWEGRIVSLEALQSAGGQSGRGVPAQTRIRWDNIALSLAVLPLLLWFITIVTAPVALLIVIWRGRKGSCSEVQRSGWRYWVAGGLALLQITAWVTIIVLGLGG